MNIWGWLGTDEGRGREEREKQINQRRLGGVGMRIRCLVYILVILVISTCGL
jgi:hypothetical protein